jgi:hypothetical protein
MSCRLHLLPLLPTPNFSSRLLSSCCAALVEHPVVWLVRVPVFACSNALPPPPFPQLTYLPHDGTPPVRYKAIVPKDGVFEDLLNWFSVSLGVGG